MLYHNHRWLLLRTEQSGSSHSALPLPLAHGGCTSGAWQLFWLLSLTLKWLDVVSKAQQCPMLHTIQTQDLCRSSDHIHTCRYSHTHTARYAASGRYRIKKKCSFLSHTHLMSKTCINGKEDKRVFLSHGRTFEVKMVLYTQGTFFFFIRII